MQSTTSEELYKLIRDSVVPHPHPAVLISGGLDSTILLHHLIEKTDEPINTYTVRLHGNDECDAAREVAEHYGTQHKTVEITNMLPTFAKLQQYFDKPRWNLWPYWAYLVAWEDKRQNIYIAEGLDEHFGGYWYKPHQTYQEYWAGILTYSVPTHRKLAELLELDLHTPFLRLPVSMTLGFWDGKHHNKSILREIYAAYCNLPECALRRKKNPGRLDFCRIWNEHCAPHIPGPVPETRAESYRVIEKWVQDKWQKAH